MERTCKKCGETKPIEEFQKCKNCDYGYSFTCKVCFDKYCRKYSKKYRQNNKEFCKELQKKWYQNNKEHRKKYRQNNRERFRQYERNYINIISDTYIHTLLRNQLDLFAQTTKQYPELIENHRQQIKVKRLLKQKKNENIKTS